MRGAGARACPALGLDSVSRTSVEMSLDAAGTSARATYPEFGISNELAATGHYDLI